MSKPFEMSNGRESYGESAIGYVQLKREGHIHTVRCCVAPEHKVTSKGYQVELVVNIMKGEIVSCKCYDCIAVLGGCKHQLALLGWMNGMINASWTISKGICRKDFPIMPGEIPFQQ